MEQNKQPDLNPVIPPTSQVRQPQPAATPAIQPKLDKAFTPQSSQPELVGSKMKLPTGWKAWFGILFLIGFALVFLVLGGWFILPILLPIGGWYFFAYKRRQSAVKAFAAKNGYTYQANTVLNDLDGVIFQNPAYILGQDNGPSSGYLFSWIVHGQIANRNFRMYEYMLDKQSGSGINNFVDIPVSVQSNHYSTRYDVMDIAVQGEGLQFLLISNTHRTILNCIDISLKRYQLEGDFNRYFSLYGADGAEIEVLQIFTPDVMAYLIDHYQAYTLELTPQHFFLYRDITSFKQTEANCDSLVAAATDLSTKIFSGIEKVHYAENAVVPASVQIPRDKSRIAGGFPLVGAMIASIVLCAFVGFGIYMFTKDYKIPSGYIKASNAKVTQDLKVNCTNYSDNNCSTTYDVTASFTTQNGQSYWHTDNLISDHPIGTSVELYYDPANPTKAQFPGSHSDPATIPILAGFATFGLVFIWGKYFIKKKST